MQYEVLRQSLLRDLEAIGVTIEFELCIKDYSSSYYGCYRTKTNRVYLYYYKDKNKTTPYPYSHLLDTAVHEAVHSMQWHDPSFTRQRGVMHNAEFYSMYNDFMQKVKELETYKEDKGTERRCVKVPLRRIGLGNVRADIVTPSRGNNPVLRVACRRKL